MLDTLSTLLSIAAAMLLVLSFLVFLIAICLPRERRSAILRHLWRRWTI
jgi:hypothetical protein